MRRIMIGVDEEAYSEFLMDASLLKGHAEEVVFCHSAQEVMQLLDACYKKKSPLTIQGAMTGICGGAVPKGGCVLNVSEMKEVKGLSYKKSSDEYFIKVGPGLLLKDLNHMLLSKKIDTFNWPKEDQNVYEHFKRAKTKFFPPDPTETLASVGGMVACDASGACSFKYGSTRPFVQSIKVICFVNGFSKELTIKRGAYTYKDIHELFNHKMALPVWHMHHKALKDVAGLYYEDDMDLIDLFIGSEGLLGIITEIELKIINAPEIKMGMMLFLDNEEKLMDFMDYLRSDETSITNHLLIKPCAIEYFDKNTLKMLNDFRDMKTEINQLPKIAESYQGGIYLEFHLEDASLLDDLMMQLLDQLKAYHINEAEQWLALEPSDYEKLKNFRHSVPECVNILVASHKLTQRKIKKVGTDMAVPNHGLKDVLEMYRGDITAHEIQGVTFGHIGNNHLHVNLMPKTLKEYETSLDLIRTWATRVVKLGGTVSAEHGIGKLKKNLLKQMMTQDDIKSMKMIKKIIEPGGLINQGTMLD